MQPPSCAAAICGAVRSMAENDAVLLVSSPLGRIARRPDAERSRGLRSVSSIDFLGGAQNGRQEINEGLSPSVAARFRIDANTKLLSPRSHHFLVFELRARRRSALFLDATAASS